MHEFKQTRALYFPAIVLVILLLSVPLRANGGILGLILVAILFCLIIPIPMALTGRVIIQDSLLTAKGVPPYSNQSRNPVNLQMLVSIYSVMRRSGLTGRVGPAFSRPFIQLIDSDGNETLLGAWGWTPKNEFRSLLSTAALQSHAKLDKLTIRRLGIEVNS